MSSVRCANGPSAARSFLQLASRSYTTSTTPSHSPSFLPLEFLAPRSPRLRTPSASSRASPPQTSRSSFQTRSPSHRTFTTSAARNATICVSKPVKDEDGNDMILNITPRAAKRLSQIMVKDSNPDLALRIQVESGGCHGFQYLMSLVTIPAKDAEESSPVTEEDSIFRYTPDEADSGSVTQSPRIVLDEPSLELLNGSKVDFVSELIGSSFQITDNPHATSSCGCGTSFDVKI